MSRKGVQGPTPERLALAARVRAYRDNGTSPTWERVAVEFGISRTYAQALYDDPDGAKARARKDSYARPCPDCGTPMTGSGGRTESPERCQACAEALQHGTRYWTRETIVESFLAFQQQTGRQPAAGDEIGRSPSQRRKFSDERLAEIDAAPRLPVPWVVQREFGSWAAALKAAGMTAGPSGEPGHRAPRKPGPAKLETLALIRESPRTARELCDLRGVTKTSVYSLVTPLVRDGTLVKTGQRYHFPGDTPPPIERKGPRMARNYVVLHKNGHGYENVGTVEALTADMAIEKKAGQPGTYVAVPEASFVEQPVGEITRLGIIREDTKARAS